MISIEEAQSILNAQIIGMPAIENISLEDSRDRVLAEDIDAPFDYPQYDNSAMDGYVLHIDDIEGDRSIAVVGEITAGTEPAFLSRPLAQKIFTGAPIPANANAVVPMELCEVHNNRVIIAKQVYEGDHIRKKGTYFKKGKRMLTIGTKIDSKICAIVSTMGKSTVSVYKKVRVAIGTTGNEVLKPGDILSKGKIYDSNTPFLFHECMREGYEVVMVEHLSDSLEQTIEFLHCAEKISDIILFSGGISVGEKDFVYAMLNKESCNIHFRKVGIKPGKPFTFASYKNTPLFCIPGNPLAVFIVFYYFVHPYLLASQGVVKKKNRLHYFPVPKDIAINTRTQFLFSRIIKSNKETIIEILSEQSSAAIQNVLLSDGALIVPANTNVKKGTILSFLSF